LRDFFSELRRRRIWWVAGAYLAVGWVGVQVAATLEDSLSLPGWVDTVALVLLIIGFPVALVLAWAQETQASEPPALDADPTDNGFTQRTTHSVAVLPFDNMSDEAELDGVVDGMIEDLTTRLSMMWPLKVSARNSAFNYKGHSPDIRRVGSELGVRFVVEGSLRAVGDTLRLNAQLIGTKNGDHVWAERLDIPRAELHSHLDETVDRLAFEILTEVSNRETVRIQNTPVDELNPLETTILANNLAYYPFSRAGVVKATDLLEGCLERHPSSLTLLPVLAMNYAWRSVFAFEPAGDNTASRDFGRQAYESIKSAVESNPSSSTINDAAIDVMRTLGRPDDAILYVNNYRALTDEPSNQVALAFIGVGRYDEALEEFDRWTQLAGTQQAADLLRQVSTIMPQEDTYETLASVLGLLGQHDEARKALKQMMSMPAPNDYPTAENWCRHIHRDEQYIERYLEGLREAGLEGWSDRS
jgi:adenylate cyclase